MTDDWDANIPLAESDVWTATAKSLLGLLDTPAYLRRAMAVQSAVTQLNGYCEKQREELIDGVRMRLRHWNRCVEIDEPTCRRLAGADFAVAAELIQSLVEDLTVPSYVQLERPLTVWEELVESVARFNRRWVRVLQNAPVAKVNELIDGYNRYYVFEKECAFRSARVAGRGFVPMKPFDFDHLVSLYPLLPELAGRNSSH